MGAEFGSISYRASACDTERVPENVSTNFWYEEVSGAALVGAMPRRLMRTFCACITGFVARCLDFLASRSLRRMATVFGGERARRRGGGAAATGEGASLHISIAKLATTCRTGAQASASI